MASRLVEVFYKLRDGFTGQVSKITGGYRKLGDEAERAGKRTEGAFAGVNRTLVAVRGGVTRLAGLLGVGLGIGAAANEVKQFTAEADKLAKLSGKLGYTVEELQRVGYVADRNGIAFDTMAVALQRATRRIAEVATTGKGEAAPALEALGLSAKQLSALNLEDRMSVLADAFAGVSDQGERVRLAFKLFDTEGVDMVRVLQDGSAAFRDLYNRADDVAGILGTDVAKAAERVSDRASDMGKRIEKALLPLKEDFLRGLDNVLARAGNYLNDQERITVSLNKAYKERESLLRQIAYLEGTGGADLDRLRAELDANKSTIKALQDEGIALQKVSAERENAAEANKKEADARKALSAERDKEIKALEDRAKATADALRKETQEYEKAKREQLAITKEFRDLVSNVTTPDDQTVSGLDVQLAQLDALRKLKNDDAQGAVDAARRGADLLEKLKQSGEESGFVLSFLAKQLQQVAEQASQKITTKELIDKEQAEKAKQRIDSALENIKSLSLDVDQASLDLVGRRLEAAVRSAAATGLRAAFDGFQAGDNLAPLIADELSRKGRK